jgi:hypothetical protein
MCKILSLLTFVFLSCSNYGQPKSVYDPDIEIKKIESKIEGGNLSDDQAIKLFKQVAELITTNEYEYQKIYALYRIMFINAKDENKVNEIIESARQCLDVMQPKIQSGSIMHFTETGKFYQEVIRYSTNAIAWYSHLKTDDRKTLTELLDVVSLGCNYTNGPEHFYIFDTKVRILLKLNRKEEAYRIVYDCLKKYKHFSDFADLKMEKDFILWKNRYENQYPTIFTDQEKQFLQKAVKISGQLRQEKSFDKAVASFSNIVFPKTEVMLLSEAQKRYGFKGDFYQEKDHYILVFNGDVYIQGNLNEQWIKDQFLSLAQKRSVFGTLVTGNLIIDGDLIDDEYIQLRVMKKLYCQYVFSYNGTIVIFQDAHVKYGIYGEYNDGFIRIDGKLYTPYIIADDHDMPRYAEGDFIYIEGGSGSYKDDVAIGSEQGSGFGWGWEYFEDSAKLLAKDVWTDEDKFSEQKFFELVKKGINPFVKLK